MSKSLIVTVIASVLMGALGARMFFTGDYPSISSPIPVGMPACGASNIQLENNLSLATDEIRWLKEQLADKNKVIAQLTQTPNEALSVSSDGQADLELTLAELKSTNFMRWLSQKTNSNPDFKLGMEMQSRFNAESIDPVWAPDQEKKIGDLFVENNDLSGLAFRDANCRTTQCQVSIGVADVDQANLIAEKMASVMAKNHFLSVIAVPDIQNGVTTIYLLDDKNNFEFN